MVKGEWSNFKCDDKCIKISCELQAFGFGGNFSRNMNFAMSFPKPINMLPNLMKFFVNLKYVFIKDICKVHNLAPKI